MDWQQGLEKEKTSVRSLWASWMGKTLEDPSICVLKQKNEPLSNFHENDLGPASDQISSHINVWNTFAIKDHNLGYLTEVAQPAIANGCSCEHSNMPDNI